MDLALKFLFELLYMSLHINFGGFFYGVDKSKSLASDLIQQFCRYSSKEIFVFLILSRQESRNTVRGKDTPELSIDI